MATFDLCVKYRRAAVNEYSYLDANWALQLRRSGGSPITTNTAVTVVICVYLAHETDVCFVHEVHVCPVCISTRVCGIRAQEDYSETHESCFSLMKMLIGNPR